MSYFFILLNLPLSRLSLENLLLRKKQAILQFFDENLHLSSTLTPIVSFLSFVVNPIFLDSWIGDYDIDDLPEFQTSEPEPDTFFEFRPALIYSNAIRRWDCLFGSDDVGLLQFYLPDLADLTTLLLAFNALHYTNFNWSDRRSMPLLFNFQSYKYCPTNIGWDGNRVT